MSKAKSFNDFIAEGEDSVTKPSASDGVPLEDPDKSQDKDSSLFDEIKGKISTCIETLEGIHTSLEGTKLSQTKIDSVIADLKHYLGNIEDEGDISNKSNQTNNN
jgi:hypothetical protein